MSFRGRKAPRTGGVGLPSREGGRSGPRENAGDGRLPRRYRRSPSGRLPRRRGIATGGVRTPWVGVKGAFREQSRARWSAAWTPAPVPTQVRLARSARCGPPKNSRVHRKVGRRRAAKTGDRPCRGWGSRSSSVVLGVRLDCRNHRAASGRDASRESVDVEAEPDARERVGAKGRRPGVLLLARWSRRKAQTGRSSDRKPASRSSMGKGTLVRGGPSRWRAGGKKRMRRVTRRRVARDKECQRSSVSSARGRQRRGGVVNHLPSGYDGTDRSSSGGVNRRGTRVEHAARRERRSQQAERPRGDEQRREPRLRELSGIRVLVKEVSCRSRWKHLLRARSA